MCRVAAAPPWAWLGNSSTRVLGKAYVHLAEVKKKCDLTGLFFVRNGVDSEEWSEDRFVSKPKTIVTRD
jgi:hypothetical protein